MRFGPAKRLFATMRFRLTFWNTITILVVLGSVLLGVRQGLNYTLMRELDQLLMEDTVEVSLELQRNFPNWERIEGFLERKSASHREHEWFGAVTGADGQIRAASSSRPPATLPTTPDAESNFTSGPNRLAHRKVVLPDTSIWNVWTGAKLEFISEDINRLTKMLLAAGAVVLIVAPLSGYWLAGRATKPLADIIQTTSRLHPDRLDERLRLRGTGDELDQLSSTINHSMDAIAEHINRQRDFVANAAHELRSPLAAIRTSVEVALDQDRTLEYYRELLGDLAEESERLSILTNRLLLLAEGDAGFMTPGEKSVSLDRLARQATEMFRGVAEHRGIALETRIDDGIYIHGDAAHLRQVVQNLIDNAIKFTPTGGHVVVETEVKGQSAVLRVQDSGVGIPSEDLPHVFDRFFRSDRSRRAKEPTAGTGLGLSICESIVRAYKGRIDISSHVGQGTTVTVTFPSPIDVEKIEDKVS